MDERQQIESRRNQAARARRLASGLTNKADRDRMLAEVARLDSEADTLERKAAAREPDKP